MPIKLFFAAINTKRELFRPASPKQTMHVRQPNPRAYAAKAASPSSQKHMLWFHSKINQMPVMSPQPYQSLLYSHRNLDTTNQQEYPPIEYPAQLHPLASLAPHRK
jgi:hypothetical protein